MTSAFCNKCGVTYALTADNRCPNCNTLIDIPSAPAVHDAQFPPDSPVAQKAIYTSRPVVGAPILREIAGPANPYHPPGSFHEPEMDAFTRPLAGFGARLLAYLIDVVPITLAVASIFYFFLGFDEAVRQYVAASDDINNRIDFLARRNQIRDFSFVVYIIYCGLLEGSAMQGTLGKRLVGVRVTDENGDRLSIARSFGRNFTKIVSYLPLGLGFIWAIWSRRKQGWHDMIARTLVIKR